MTRSLRIFLPVAAIFAFTVPLASAAAEPISITATVTSLRNTEGKVWFCLWKEGQTAGFPRCDKTKPAAKLSAPANAPQVTFSGVEPGSYAVSIFHDEKQTGTPEVNLIGLPKSGVGISNNPKIGITSPPSFDKARFAASHATQIRIEAKYLF